MAKLNYSAPMFKICPIPLSESAIGPCAYPCTSGDYVCPTKDPFLNVVLFMTPESSCERIAVQDDSSVFACYHVPLTDFNVYNS